MWGFFAFKDMSTIAIYETDDGYTLRVFTSTYMDFGFEIEHDGREVFYSPSCLSSDCYGIHWEDEDGNPLDEGVDWTPEEWKECLENEADSFIEAYD